MKLVTKEQDLSSNQTRGRLITDPLRELQASATPSYISSVRSEGRTCVQLLEGAPFWIFSQYLLAFVLARNNRGAARRARGQMEAANEICLWVLCGVADCIGGQCSFWRLLC